MSHSIITSIVIVEMIISLVCGDFCDICVCRKTSELTQNDLEVINSQQIEEFYFCNGLKQKAKETHQEVDLNSVQWPRRNGSVSAQFNNFRIAYLTDVLCRTSTNSPAPTLLALNLDNNAIEHIVNDPFKYCKNLTSISIANNLIDDLPSDLFESTHSLQRVNISQNSLSEFNGRILSRCKHIIELDVSHNQITVLKVNEILDASPNIETINASDNLLFAISDNNQNKYLHLKNLILSGNNLTVITSSTFLSYPSLEYLNISSNVLANIENNAFQEINLLKILDLSSNNLKDLSLELPESIEHISLARNRLKHWPMKNYPRNLLILELQDNELTNIFNNIPANRNSFDIPSLKFINISTNHISSVPPKLSYPNLEVFDASYNAFQNIPTYIGAQAPALKVLLLKGNPIKTIQFATKITAHILDLSELPLLKELDANVFNVIDSKKDCVELIISHNPNLQTIRNSFERVPNLCRLDLSHNNLKLIDHNWMNWSALNHGADLQGNPIDCTCNSQWILDLFIPMIYENPKNHHYLYDLRCASPEQFKNHRLVRYFNHSGSFCRKEMAQMQYGSYLYLNMDQENDYELKWYEGFGLWITIALIVIIISSTFSIIFILSYRTWHNHRTIKANYRRFHNGGIL